MKTYHCSYFQAIQADPFTWVRLTRRDLRRERRIQRYNRQRRLARRAQEAGQRRERGFV